MVTKFSEKFAIIMLKKHRKFCRCGLTHLDATPTFKNRPNTYDAPCTAVAWREKMCKHFVFNKYFSLVLGVFRHRDFLVCGTGTLRHRDISAQEKFGTYRWL